VNLRRGSRCEFRRFFFRASSHSGCIGGNPLSENRPNTWLDPTQSRIVRFLLHHGRVISQERNISVAFRAKRTLSRICE
jgi:hypothetical protein